MVLVSIAQKLRVDGTVLLLDRFDRDNVGAVLKMLSAKRDLRVQPVIKTVIPGSASGMDLFPIQQHPTVSEQLKISKQKE